jgi:hypothetical protein
MREAQAHILREDSMPDLVPKTEFPSLPKDVQDAANLVQAQFIESLAALDARVAALGAEQSLRKKVAILLKVVSVLSGLVIATGFVTGSAAQVLGGFIPGIAALERVFANLSRLLAVSAAKNAYERIRRSVVARHSRFIVDVVKIRDRDPEKAANLFIKTNGTLRDDLAKKRDEIEDKLSHNDYDNLGRLSLDEKDEATV